MSRTHFGPFLFDSAASQLTREGVAVEVQPKVLQLLDILVASPGMLHGREELQQQLWPDVHVTDQSLRQVVHKLREILGEGFVETVPRLGLRFSRDVVREPDETALLSAVLQVLDLDPLPIDAKAIAHALDLPSDTVVSALRELHESSALSTEGLPMQRQAAPPVQVRQHLHARLAEAFASTPERAAHHLEAAGQHYAAHDRYCAVALRTGSLAAHEGALRTADEVQHEPALVQAFLSAIRLANTDRASAWMADLRALAVQTQRPSALVNAALCTAAYSSWQGALTDAKQALADAASLGAEPTAIALGQGVIATYEGRLDDAYALFEGALQGNVDQRLAAHNGLGAVCGMRGDLVQATVHHETALAEARRHGRLATAARLLNNLGATAQRQGDLERAALRLSECQSVALHIGDAFVERMAALHLAMVLTKQGRVGPAFAIVGAPDWEASSDRDRAMAIRMRGQIERSVGRYAQAAAWAREAKALYAGLLEEPLVRNECFNEALSTYRAQRNGMDALYSALEALAKAGRADLLTAARVDVSLCEQDADRAEAIIDDLPVEPGRTAVARARIAFLRGHPVAHTEAGGLLGIYASALTNQGEDGLRAARLQTAPWLEGLDAAQRAAFDHKVAGWFADPRHW